MNYDTIRPVFLLCFCFINNDILKHWICFCSCRNPSWPAEVDLCWKAAWRWTHAVRLQHSKGEQRKSCCTIAEAIKPLVDQLLRMLPDCFFFLSLFRSPLCTWFWGCVVVPKRERRSLTPHPKRTSTRGRRSSSLCSSTTRYMTKRWTNWFKCLSLISLDNDRTENYKWNC